MSDETVRGVVFFTFYYSTREATMAGTTYKRMLKTKAAPGKNRLAIHLANVIFPSQK